MCVCVSVSAIVKRELNEVTSFRQHSSLLLHPPPVSHPLVRLVNGNSEGEGRVEVFHAGEWGTVCDDHWSEIDANIVCKEIGFARAISASGFATFGEGSGTVS